MALCRTVGLLLNTTKSVLGNPCFVIPSSVNMQLRNARRKGYRQMDLLKKKAQKLEKAENKPKTKEYKKYARMEKTIEEDIPDPPNDDIFIRDDFKHVKYSLSEAVKLHREYHHPTVYNNPEAIVSVKLEINMVAKKLTKVIKPFSGVASIPHPFLLSYKKQVMVICDPSEVEDALQCGASIAGGVDIVKKIQGGIIHPALYEFIICHVNLLSELTPIRNLLKNQMPKLKLGTLTNDIKSAIYRLLYGVEYSCIKGSAQNFGVVQCKIGTIDMELQHLEENFKALLTEILKYRPVPDREFITWIWCTSHPSDERFSIDVSQYIESGKKKPGEIEETEDDDSDDEEPVSETLEEKRGIEKLKQELETKTLNE